MMASEDSDIDVVNVDDTVVTDLVPDVGSPGNFPEVTHDILKSFVCARTDGVRQKRPRDYCVSSDDSSIADILEPADSEPISHQVEPTESVHETFSSVSRKRKEPPFRDYSTLSSKDIEARNDIFDIQNNHIGQYSLTIDGVNQLLLSHRAGIVEEESSDDEKEKSLGLLTSEVIAVSSSDSDENDILTVKSSVAELRDMAKLDIKDRNFRENFPEVEIIDLQLTEVENICSLGNVFQIVEDFVVIKNCTPGKILDLDSMVFNKGKKCIGYIFEVLGPVAEPYYSIRFNTNSDIKLLGLEVGQELFYSPNERYSRYLLLELLQEFEQKRLSRVHDSNLWSSDDSESDNESTVKAERPKKKPIRRTEKNVFTRSTNNYTINYLSQPRTAPINKNSSVSGQDNSHFSAFDNLLRNYKPQNDVIPNSTGFKNSVLSSFLE